MPDQSQLTQQQVIKFCHRIDEIIDRHILSVHTGTEESPSQNTNSGAKPLENNGQDECLCGGECTS
jgi:hypothetical protein